MKRWKKILIVVVIVILIVVAVSLVAIFASQGVSDDSIQGGVSTGVVSFFN